MDLFALKPQARPSIQKKIEQLLAFLRKNHLLLSTGRFVGNDMGATQSYNIVVNTKKQLFLTK